MKKALLLVLAAILLFTFSACGTQDQKATSKGPKTIKIAHGASESYHMHRAWLKFKEELEKGGKFKVEIYPSSQFGNDAEMIESVKTGDLTIATPPSSFLTDEAPKMALIELPYVFPSRQAAIDTLNGEWGQARLKELEDNGLVGLGYLENGLRHLTNSKRPVRTPEDLKGLKLRTMQVPAHVYLWNDLGATAEGAPFPELYTNLSTGVFDGQENPIAHIYSQKFYEVQDYITLTGHVYTAYVPVVNIDFWNSLSEEEKREIREAFEVARKYQLSLIEEEEAQQLEEIRNNKIYPTTVIELTSEEKQKFIDAAQPTLQHYRDKLGAEAFDEFMAAVKKASK
ncbi:Solute-binding protein [Koleobacter methoxysyntrophicus]|jgi:tripartite ATP-independent transporter DctP family solute receptor|uniref:Solute-binding protein n=1 Tax=Koleobacter methoxysyntrophicus TaxID=2751313 RepID=A0A8A0RPZ7_9FIRM|nr:DctP family TRAP transporter solute-binding subunit [Koleobacter methoxysyntrophicus]QSQ09276.1 Solute-binding protein [Koleobacter methoxysyntrophicus]